jgi:hypothetical protein
MRQYKANTAVCAAAAGGGLLKGAANHGARKQFCEGIRRVIFGGWRVKKKKLTLENSFRRLHVYIYMPEH